MKTLPNVVHTTSTVEQPLTVLGDIHGQLPDMLHIFDSNEFPSETNRFLFNGDIVDRGKVGRGKRREEGREKGREEKGEEKREEGKEVKRRQQRFVHSHSSCACVCVCRRS